MAVAAALLLPVTLGCEAAPRQRPVKMGPVDAGPGSVEWVRRQLQGTWVLTGLDLFSPSGERIAAQATGRLEYDEFSNLSMQGNLTAGPEIDSSVLNLTGRVAIDPKKQTLQFQDVDAPTPDGKRVDPLLAATHVRYYELTGDLLKITVKDAKGLTTATATWKKVS